MKGWKKPKAFAVAYSAQKRFLAFVLTLAMLFTSVGTDLNVSYAAQGNKVDFEIYGSELVDAIDQAVESDSVVTPDSLEFTNGAIDKFETLFYGEGKVYEVYPQIDGGDMEAELRVFVRLPEDADDMYMVTGDEEVIFLYVNNGDETISCATRIIRSEDGEEKVKTTKRINVKSYEDKFGDEEVDIISKKDETVEETTAVEEKTQDTVNDVASEETTAAEEKETEITDETTEAPEEETTEAAEENTEAETEEATEAEKETEAETEKETAEETEKETAEEKADAEGEVTASVSRHYAPVVAMKEDAEAAPEKETAEAVETEKETTEKETTEAVEKETAEAVETEKETTEAESKDAEVEETETEVTDETSETEETAEDVSKEETAAGSKENEETEATKETQVETSKEAETTAEVKEEETKKAEAATDSDLVGIGYCSTAKAYTTTVKALKALDDVQGLKVTYAINPEYSARIVDGPRGVEEGDALVFGVKNQIGYAIESVTANGEILEADSTSENEDGSVTAWYNVPEVTEEQEIEVYMTETDEHPEFNAELTMEDGTIITLHAAEGVLPAGVTAEATVKNELADALKEKVEAENEEGGAVKTIVVYDINLMLNGHKLDNTWSQNGSVEVTFSGSKIEEMSADAAAIEICALDDASLENPVAENLNVEHIATEDVADTTKDSVSFEAEHFTAYAMYGWDWKPGETNVKKGTFNLGLTNVEAAYAYFNDTDSSASAKITPVSESFTIDNFCSSQKNGYIVFFVKPAEGYLLTGTEAGVNGTRGDLYSLTLSNFGNINSYPGIHALAAKAKELGYMGCFGYSRYSNSPSEVNAPITVEGVKPSLSVSAVSSKTTGVKPGDELTFTITVTPSRSIENVALTVEEVQLTDVKINGKQVSYGELVEQWDGTYVTTATYVVTNPDCLSGEVKLDVDAETTYSYSLQYRDDKNSVSYVNTTAAATASASTTCSIASKGEYSYVLDYQGVKAGMTYEDYPDEVKTGIPAGGTIYEGQKFNLAQLPEIKYVDDPANEGYWTLGDKWNFNNQQFEGGAEFTARDKNQRIVFTAIWTFNSYETIRYEVAMGKGSVDRSSETLNPTSGTVSGSTANPDTGYEFAGWYSNSGCADASKVGIANTFVPSEIKSATYYAKFVPKKDVAYTVHYYIVGTTTKVADDKVVSDQTFDSEVTENAQIVAGYDVVGENSQTFALDAYGKEITFFYNAKTLSYTVNYLEKGTNKVLRDRKTVDGTAFGTKVEEDAVVIPGYTVDANKKTIEKLDYSHRSITFFYEENGEVVLKYEVEAGQESMGSVTPNAEGVRPASGTPKGSTANVKDDSYSFVNWTVNGEAVSTNEKLTSADVAAHAKNKDNVFVPTTFVAHFQQKIVVTANSNTKIYDGHALTGTDIGYTYTGTVKAGDTLAVTLTGEQKDVGIVPNHVADVKVYRGTTDVTDEYAFGTHVDGKLEVTRATVTMKSASKTKTYDGMPLTKTDEMVITGFAEGEGVECYNFASRTDVGSTYNTFEYRAASNTKLSNYDIKPENIKYGTLTVNKITTPIVVSASRRSKPYDGTALTGENYYTVTGDENLISGDRLVVELSGSITNVSDAENGTVTNKIATCKVMRGNEDVTDNYTVETHDGTLTITPRKITVTSATRQKAYDGTPLTDGKIEENSFGTYAPFVTGEGLVYDVTGSQLDEGTSDNTFTYKAKEGTNLANYDITKVEGKLTVTKNANEIVITANSDSKIYDGTPLINSGYTYTTGVLANGDVLTAEVEGTITDAGETKNEVKSYVVKRGDKDVTKNYTFGENVPGTLKVTERKVTITSGSSKRAYNGQPLTNSDITVTGDGFVAGEEPTAYNVTGTVTNVGKVKNTFTYALPADVNPDNYIITEVEGELEITPVTTKIQITADSDSKVYDGTALVKNSATYTEGILAKGDTLEVTVEGAQSGKGESANTVTAYKVLNTAGDDVTKNYTFAESIPGKLTVTARPITITADSAEKEYDGTPLTKDTYQVTGVGLATGEEISEITIEGEQVEIGTSSNAVKKDSVRITKAKEAANTRSAAESEDTTANYDIILVPGELKVTNRYDLSYTVNYHYLDAKGNEVEVESVTKSDAFIGEAIAYSDAASRVYNDKTYALIRVENAGKNVEYYSEGSENPNVVDVYYGLDEIGTNPEKPTTPDGTPDMYQVVFRYISENPSYGTVDGAAVIDGYVMEVVTRPQKADGSYDMDAEVYPQGNVIVTGIGNYVFNHWSDDDTNYANAKEIAGHGFKTDMTFVAHFSYNGGNNNNNNGGGNGGNGGGNGGSGSSTGGGSSSSGSRGSITVTSGGPGDQTVTIDAGDVPLAGLPDLPASPVEIDDGEVPLAALPKTGQTTMKLTITLMFSGIFLALTAMSKKHKDEES